MRRVWFLLGCACALQLLAPLGRAQANDRPLTRGRYIAGGIVGTAFGFGIGHGVVGEYADKGWIFTLGEAGGLGLVVAGLTITAIDTADRTSRNEERVGPAGPVLTLTGVGLIIGFRIWEVIDIWTGPKKRIERRPRWGLTPPPHLGAAPLLLEDGGGVQLRLAL